MTVEIDLVYSVPYGVGAQVVIGTNHPKSGLQLPYGAIPISLTGSGCEMHKTERFSIAAPKAGQYAEFTLSISGVNHSYPEPSFAQFSVPGVVVDPPGAAPAPVATPRYPVVLPGGNSGSYYDAWLKPYSGTLPYDFSLAGGNLPAGLDYYADRDRAGLRGIPEISGSYSFVIAFSDASGLRAFWDVSISIQPRA